MDANGAFEHECDVPDSRAHDEELKHARDELRELREINQALRRERDIFEDQIREIQSSLGWLLLSRVTRLRLKVIRPETLPGRCWALASRFLLTARTAGTQIALRKARERLVRKIGRLRHSHSASGTRFLGQVNRQSGAVDRFRELPWKFLGHAQSSVTESAGHFKVLLVSHSACRTGAPLCLLRVAEELSKTPGIECFVVHVKGGELSDSFARIAPTLEVEWVVAQGFKRLDVPRVIASAFHEFSSRGVAVCNTLATSEFHDAFADFHVNVLSWIHELPTFISLLGGDRSIEAIKRASRTIMVPSQAVSAALSSRYQVDESRIRTNYNGQDPRTLGLDRDSLRLQVRRELKLPDDARIVLGCGTVDLRKGSDIFVNVARRVLLDDARSGQPGRTWFVWVGDFIDENLRRWLLHDCKIGGLQDRIQFIGLRKNVTKYYMAADLFALTSREDPCPLVNMEAMESGLAVIAFSGAGGAPEVLGDAGICVPYLDQAAMASAIRDLLADQNLRRQMGARGRERIWSRFTWTRFLHQFLGALQADFGYRASRQLKVSVIVPNYRHALYLEERIQSILDQTLSPHEIIFLDDASPDESVEVMRRLARHSSIPIRIVVNEQNSGSTFRQWLKGLSLATGDLVWIAESDDSAHPYFLERLVPEFFDPEVALAYCQSALIGSQGQRLGDDFLAHTDDICPTHWRRPFSANASDEVEFGLSQKNTIPNASAVVFRRPQHLDFADELTALKFAGDWLFYIMIIRGARVNYLPEVLNYYRRHEATVTHRSVRDDSQAYETLSVKARVLEEYAVTANAIAGSLARSVFEYNELTERFDLKRPAFSENPLLEEPLARLGAVIESRLDDPSALRVFLVLSDLAAGAETQQAVELANELAQQHTVFLCNAQPELLDESVTRRLSPRLIRVEGTVGPTPWSRADLQSANSSRRGLVLAELIRLLRVDLVHSHSTAADHLILASRIKPPVPWLLHAQSMVFSSAQPARDPNSSSIVASILNEACGFFYEDPSEIEWLECYAPAAVEGKPRWILEREQSIASIAASCTEAYLQRCSAIAFRRAANSLGTHQAVSTIPLRKRA